MRRATLIAFLLIANSLSAQSPQPYDGTPTVWDDTSTLGSQAADNSSTRWIAPDSRDPSKYVHFELGTIGLFREAPDSQLLAFDESFNPLLNANELQGSMQFGLRAFMDVHNVSLGLGGTDLQLGYFGINSLDAERPLAAAEVNTVFFNSIPATPLQTANVLYSSNIYSGEANLCFRNRKRVRPIAGLRYLKLEETYDAFNHDPSGGRLGGFSLTNNHLFGGQFGCAATLFRLGYFEFYSSGKFAVMHNRVDGSTSAADVSGTPVTKNFSDSEFATLLDVEAGTTYWLNDAMAFKLGYQLLYADDVAMGIDQNASVRILSPGDTVAFNSQQWHGLNLSAEFSF
ncbi:MAG: BBP7 family outer membrane beta-barrel protein [Planctomycetales bacterium]|nr:BBP7 family outer membrane beta-barrel protein [Planctomycetales bacterium]